jgi:hypothetical protein
MALISTQHVLPTSESITSNTDQHWALFEASELCFVTEPSLPVITVDVLAGRSVRQYQVFNERALTTSLGNAGNPDLKHRLV